MGTKGKTTLRYIIEGLIPYTEANIKLTFKPSMFFDDLERISNRSNQTIKNAYYKAIKNGLIELDHRSFPRLTEEGLRKVKPYKPKKLRGSSLIVMFDIPEADRWKRQRLRAILRELKFRQIQKSVWQTKFDHREYLKAEIEQNNLGRYVLMYEARRVR